MNKEHIYISNNKQETLDRLVDEGYYICHCCKFAEGGWLSVYPYSEHKSVHGEGYSCENDCKDANTYKCIHCSINECIKCGQTVHIYPTVEDFLQQT